MVLATHQFEWARKGQGKGKEVVNQPGYNSYRQNYEAEGKMAPNLGYYYKVLSQLRPWFPQGRITRLRNMALLMIGLHWSGSVQLGLIVRKWPIAGKLPSLVNRLWRFLSNPGIEPRVWYRPIAQQLIRSFGGRRLQLVIDCTKVGFNYRLMTVGLAYKKRVLPLVWRLHRGQKGHTTAASQVALFRVVQPWLPQRAQVWVVGDSGFQSVPLLRWLHRQGWLFVIRQQGRIKVRPSGQTWLKLNELALQPGQTRYLGWGRLTEKHDAGWFWLIVHWARGEDDPWYLIANTAGRRRLIRCYKRRMGIEELYGDLKGHGFDLEATHLKDPDRIDRLILAVCLTFVWFITLGSWVVKRGFRHLLDHRSRLDKSYFRLGWDWLERCLRLALPLPPLRLKPYF
jgi:hypothetical protein